MPRSFITDIAIIGGGIAGLWLLNRLRNAGYHALLLESDTLGGGQTIASQGIIHSGAKYTLTGKLTPAAQAVANMPSIWQACLDGVGDIDLRSARILSQHQYLWSLGGLASQIAAFFASKTLRSRVTSLSPKNYPDIFQHPDFHGRVYELAETVLDVPSLIHALVQPCQDLILHGELKDYDIQAQRYIFTAGAGNEKYLPETLQMQRRPLQMVIVKHKIRMPIYAHCIEASPKPRITITTHTAADGDTIWYLGGQLAEAGVNKTELEQCQAAKTELELLFPWFDFSTAQWSTLNIDRAEPSQANGQLPDGVFVREVDDKIITWPTKLALAPQLAIEVLELLKKANITPQTEQTPIPAHPTPDRAKPVWDGPRNWHKL
jgi:glycerol-3-phosphate dehydrogenase